MSQSDIKKIELLAKAFDVRPDDIVTLNKIVGPAFLLTQGAGFFF